MYSTPRSIISGNRVGRHACRRGGAGQMEHAVQQTPERQAFYNKIDGENLSALWNVLGALITPEPKSACQPFLWRFDAIRERMTESGRLITAKEAERRVLI